MSGIDYWLAARSSFVFQEIYQSRLISNIWIDLFNLVRLFSTPNCSVFPFFVCSPIKPVVSWVFCFASLCPSLFLFCVVIGNASTGLFFFSRMWIFFVCWRNAGDSKWNRASFSKRQQSSAIVAVRSPPLPQRRRSDLVSGGGKDKKKLSISTSKTFKLRWEIGRVFPSILCAFSPFPNLT